MEGSRKGMWRGEGARGQYDWVRRAHSGHVEHVEDMWSVIITCVDCVFKYS